MTEYGLTPYDLAPPAKTLLHHCLRKSDRTEVKAGSGENTATIIKVHWHPCADGGCEAGDVYQIRVPCEQIPHCNACECSPEHIVTLSEADLRAIKGLLP